MVRESASRKWRERGWKRKTSGCTRAEKDRGRGEKEEKEAQDGREIPVVRARDSTERERERRPSPPIVTIEVASLNCRLRAFNSRSKDRNDPSVPSRHWPLFPTSKLLLNSSLPRSRAARRPNPFGCTGASSSSLLSLRFSLSATDRPLCRFIEYAMRMRAMKRIRGSLKEKRG